MKKKIAILLTLVIGILLVACGNSGKGTYFPDSSEMQSNLQNKKYEVTVQEVRNDKYSGTCLTATKDDEYIEFYWLNDGNGIEFIEQELIVKYPDYAKVVSMENDSKFGTFIFCSSKNAMDDAGIVIVEVKVNV